MNAAALSVPLSLLTIPLIFSHYSVNKLHSRSIMNYDNLLWVLAYIEEMPLQDGLSHLAGQYIWHFSLLLFDKHHFL